MKINITVPQKWDELSEWQCDRIGRLLFHGKKEDRETYRYIMLFILFLKPSFKRVVQFAYVLTQVPLSELLQYTDFLTDKKEIMTRFRPGFKVRAGLTKTVKLVGPAARLSNITIQELSYADTFFYNWITGQKDVDLHRLCAVLYRPEDPAGSRADRREKFDPLLLEHNAALTDKIPLHHKYMIALAYQGSRELFARRYPKVFPRRKQPEGTEAPKPKGGYSPFTKVINAMAMDESQPFGPLKDAEKTPANQFLEIFNETLLRQERQEAALKKSTTKRR